MSEEVRTKVDGALIDVIDLESEVQEVTPARKLKLQAKSQEAIAKVQYEVMKEMLKQAEATVSLAQAAGKMEEEDRISKLREHAENFGSVMTEPAQNQFMASLAEDANKEEKQAVLSQFEDTLTEEERKNLIASLEDNVDFLREKMAEFDTYYSRMLQSSSRVLKTPDKRFKSLLKNGIVARIINKVKNKILGDNPIADTETIENTANKMNRVFDEVGQQYNKMEKPMDRKYDFTDIDTAGIQEEVNKIFDGMKKDEILDKSTDEIKDQVLNPDMKSVDEEEEKLKSILNEDVEKDQDLEPILPPKVEDDMDLSRILKDEVEEKEPEIDFDEPIFPEEDKGLGVVDGQGIDFSSDMFEVVDYKKLYEEALREKERYEKDNAANYKDLQNLIDERETMDEELARVEEKVKEKEKVYNENARRKEEAERRRKEAEEQVDYAKKLSELNQKIAQEEAKKKAIEKQREEEKQKLTASKDKTEKAMEKLNDVTKQNNTVLRETNNAKLQLEALRNECEEIMLSGTGKVSLTEDGKKALANAGIDLTSSNTYPFDTPSVSWVTTDTPVRSSGRGRR